MKLSHLLKDLKNYEVHGSQDEEITGIEYHSQKIKPGNVFVAIKGNVVDGRNYVSKAVDDGAKVLIFEGEFFDNLRVAQVRVSGARLALAKISARYFDFPSKNFYLAGVTGTNGKTTITYLLESLWKKNTGVIGTINTRYLDKMIPSQQTTPESRDLQEIFYEMKKAHTKYVAIEVSSHALIQNRVSESDFDAAVFTNLSQDHMDFHSDLNDYFEAKKILFSKELKESSKKNKLAVICCEDEFGKKLFGELNGVSKVSYGFDTSNTIYPKKYTITMEGISAELVFKDKIYQIQSELLGKFNLLNLMAAVVVADHSGLTQKEIEERIPKISFVPGRLERIKDKKGRHIFVDYAHTDDALKNVLSNLKEWAPQKIITVFGCGGNRDKSKRPKMAKQASTYSDVCIVTSDNPRMEKAEDIINDILPGINKQCEHFVESDRKKAIMKALKMAKKNDVVLIAGKGHEDYQIIGKEKFYFSDQKIVRENL